MYHCGGSVFQYFTAMYGWFAGLPHHFHNAGLSYALFKGQRYGGPKGSNPDFREGGGALPSQTFQFS
jgi:hypothetical protein